MSLSNYNRLPLPGV